MLICPMWHGICINNNDKQQQQIYAHFINEIRPLEQKLGQLNCNRQCQNNHSYTHTYTIVIAYSFMYVQWTDN